MTVNKAQGQTLTCVGVYLERPCFSHGQFYVAASRVGLPENIMFAIEPNQRRRRVPHGQRRLRRGAHSLDDICM